MRRYTRRCESCGSEFEISQVGRPWTKCDQCVSPKIAAQRVRRKVSPAPNSIPCDDCGYPIGQTRSIEGVETLCRECAGGDSTMRRFTCSHCSVKFVRRHRGGPSTSMVVQWLCDDCEQLFKWCRRCGSVKPLDEFSANNGRRVAKSHSCRACTSAVYATTTDKDFETARKYGFSKSEFLAFVQQHRARCGICGVHKSDAPRGYLMVDHDHKCCSRNGSCGKCVRGLLCMSCNIGIGNLADDIERLQAAISYLSHYRGALFPL